MKNETVLITGASSGIGWELARLFAADKSNLILVARSHDAFLEQVALMNAEILVGGVVGAAAAGESEDGQSQQQTKAKASFHGASMARVAGRVKPADRLAASQERR